MRQRYALYMDCLHLIVSTAYTRSNFFVNDNFDFLPQKPDAPRNITAPRIDLCILLIAPRSLPTSLPNYPFPLPIRFFIQ